MQLWRFLQLYHSWYRHRIETRTVYNMVKLGRIIHTNDEISELNTNRTASKTKRRHVIEIP